MKKKIISLALVLSLLVSVFAVLPAVSVAAVESNNDTVLTEEEKNADKLTIKEGADGTEAAPVEIWNKSQLLDFAARVNGTGAYAETKNIRLSAILKADVKFNEGYTYSYDEATLLVKVTDANGVTAYLGTGLQTAAGAIGTWYSDTKLTKDAPEGFVKPEEWAPIGSSGMNSAYKGSFNGNGHVVSGIFVCKNTSGLGFFGYTGSDATSGVNITGLTVKDSCVIGTGSVGGVVGYMATNHGDVYGADNGKTAPTTPCDHTDGVCELGYKADLTANTHGDYAPYNNIKSISASYCNNENTLVVGTGSKVGGVVGEIIRTNHYFKASNGTTYFLNNRSSISGNEFKYLENSGTILNKSGTVAGVLGYADFGIYTQLYNYGTVYSLGSTVAGVVPGGDNVSVTYAYNYGNVIGNDKVAGISTLRNRGLTYCLNTGDVTATTNRAAGIAYSEGDGRDFSACANLGTIKGKIASGIYLSSVAGKAYTVAGCYNAGTIEGSSKAAQLIYTNGAASINFYTSNKSGTLAKTSFYLDGVNVPAYVNDATTTVLKSAEPTPYKADEIKSGELAEKLNADFDYFHQLLSDSYPMPGAGKVDVPIEGNGSAETPFLIYTARQLKEFSARVNADSYVNEKGETVTGMEKAHARLMADINLNPGFKFEYVEESGKKLLKMTDPNGVSAYIGTGHGGTTRGAVYSDTNLTANAPAAFVSPVAWTPIGNTENSAYRGTFEGNGHVVSGLYIKSASTGKVGFFGFVSGNYRDCVKISGVKLENYCVVGDDYVGALVGYATMFKGGDVACSSDGHVITQNVDANGKVLSTTVNCTCGMNYTGTSTDSSGYIPMSVTNCSGENGVVAGDSYVGGVIGASGETRLKFTIKTVKNVVDAQGAIQSSSNSTSTYEARSRNSHDFRYNYNYGGTVLGTGDNLGGVTGRAEVGSVSYNGNYADVIGDAANADYVGGVMGSCNNVSLGHNYNYGDVSGKTLVGGIIGSTTRGISYGFNAGNISGTGTVGGIAGNIGGGGITLNYCGNVGNVTGTTSVGGIAGAASQSSYDAAIKNSYSVGTVTGTTKVGGLLGFGDSGTTSSTLRKYTITNNYVLDGSYTATQEGAIVADFATLSENKNTASSMQNNQLLTATQVADGTLLGKLDSNFGQSVNMAYPVLYYKTSLAGTDVTLKDGILLNFYVEVSRKLTSKVGDAELVTMENGKQYYKVTVEVDAKEMGDKQSVTVADATYTKSVAEYAAGILAGEEYTAEAKALVQAMLNYGAAAQNYFGKTDELVGTPETDTSALENLEVSAPTITNPTNKYIGSSLILEGKMKLRFYFRGNDVAVTVDGNDATVVNGNETYCYVDVDVTPDNIDKFYKVECADATVLYSALNYLKNNVANEALAEMVASIYAYNVAANAFVD